MDEMGGFQSGFKDYMAHKPNQWQWGPEDTIAVAVVVVIIAVAFLSSQLFQRYRFFVRAGRKERKKRDFLTRLLVDRGMDRESETILIRRLVKYYSHTEISGKLAVEQEQLVEFSRHFLRLMRRLEFDKRGRLVIPEIEKEMEAAARRPPAEVLGSAAEEAERPSTYITKDMSKEAKVALNFIRMRQPKG